MAARRSARNTPMLKEAQEGVKGEPSPGVPPLRAAPAARSPCDLRTPAVIRRLAGEEPRPYRGRWELRHEPLPEAMKKRRPEGGAFSSQ